MIYSISPEDENILLWTAILLPTVEPYKSAKLKVTITYPAEYPFKPPKVVFNTPIYHPNIDANGQICLPLISPENWKPATRTMQILNSLISLVLNPEPEHPLRADVADEFKKNRAVFNKKADQLADKYREKKN
ncbi:ubiquitin-conjugating enzyme E2 L3-like [Anneissia japonica]|uniref:ubiquitin-conjugating enzyme E2 L3-like n=1 Tax=Anneissia japonica TaxID=1529436 RepID=UPI0014258947|nr:ubiquitin-conjugating enzyme E2 L3-like [Anneissia japonica]